MPIGVIHILAVLPSFEIKKHCPECVFKKKMKKQKYHHPPNSTRLEFTSSLLSYCKKSCTLLSPKTSIRTKFCSVLLHKVNRE